MSNEHVATLALEDGTLFVGQAFGAKVTRAGEAVFNTSMSGVVELMTDPSYCDQILTLTVTEVGNVGVPLLDKESARIHAVGLVVRSLSPVVSNWRSDLSLDEWLAQEGVGGIAGVDTRALVLHLREHGAMRAVLSTEPGHDAAALVEQARSAPAMKGRSLCRAVTCEGVQDWTDGLVDEAGNAVAPLRAPTKHVVAMDLGMKHSIARLLVHHGCKVTVVPSTTTADDILALNPDGIFLSNGPGDPSTEKDAVEAVKGLVGKRPIFGICMGHQLLSQAFGAETYKTRFGHRGGNQPVKTPEGRVLITSQNHGFAVQKEALSGAEQSHENVSDGTNEGIDAKDAYAFSVQYHPEAAPGPHDARPHFEEFIALMDRFAADRQSA